MAIGNCDITNMRCDLQGLNTECGGLSAFVISAGAFFGCLGTPCCCAVPFISWLGAGMAGVGGVACTALGITCTRPQEEPEAFDNMSVPTSVDLDEVTELEELPA